MVTQSVKGNLLGPPAVRPHIAPVLFDRRDGELDPRLETLSKLSARIS